MKFIGALFVCMGLSVSADANSQNFLAAHQTTTITMSIPSGKSTVLVGAAGKEKATPLSCTFYDANGNVALKQEHAILCWGNTPNLVRSTTITVKITNEADEAIQYSVAVRPFIDG